jgi:hypothetical protein
MYVGSHVNYSCQILMKIEFSQQIPEKCSNIKLMKIRPVSAELFHTEEQTIRQTDRLYMIKSEVTFRNFANTALLFIRFLSFQKQAMTISSKHV